MTKLLAFLLMTFGTVTYGQTQQPDHHDGTRFKNPYHQHTNNFFGIIKARLSKQWISYKPRRDIVPTAQPVLATEATVEPTVTWIGHATALIQYRGINVLTDPIFSQFASPLTFAGPRRITQPAITLETLPKIDAVLISHDHYDHLDTKTIKALGNKTHYFVPLGIKAWMIDKGINADRISEFDWWDSKRLIVNGDPLTLTATPAQHFSGRSLWKKDHTLWSSWAIKIRDFNIWFGGDTGYNDVQFKEIGNRLGPFDLALIPIGAYEPRWFMKTVHVNPHEAVLIHQDIRAKQSMGIHWGAFVLSGEGVLAPPRDLSKARELEQLTPLNFATLAVGETRVFATDP